MGCAECNPWDGTGYWRARDLAVITGLHRPLVLLCQEGSSQDGETETNCAGSRNKLCSGLVEAVTLPLRYGHRTGPGDAPHL